MRGLELVLAEVPLFQGMDAERLELLAGCASNVHFEPGEVLFREGDGKDVQLTATLANASDKPARGDRDNLASNDSGAKLGLALRPLDPSERSQVGVPSGLVIEDAAGAAQAAGVQPGDVLLSVNGKPVSTVQQVREVVRGSSKSVALLILRGDDKIFIPVRIG